MSLPQHRQFRFSWLRRLVSLSLTALCHLNVTAQTQPAPPKTAVAYFTDVAQRAGLTAPIVFGGKDTKKYIIETTGTAAAILDYDNDGWPDRFIVNGTTLEGFPTGQAPTNHLYRNNHDGTFTDVTV